MPRTRITWIILGAVVAVLAVAGVDALRSPDDEAVASATTGQEVGEAQRSTCPSATISGNGTTDITFTGDGDGRSATSEDAYSFTYPREWARRGKREEVERLGYGRFFTTAFAPDAETACAPGFAPDLESRLPGKGIFAPGDDALVLFEIGHAPGNDLDCDWINSRTTAREIRTCVDEYLVPRLLRERQGEVWNGLTLVTVAGLPAVRSRIDLGRGVALQETMIFDRTAWYFLACRFSSAEMERGCSQVEETFETVDEVVDEAGHTLPGCTRKQTEVSVTARKDGEHWDASLLVAPVTEGCREGYQYFRMVVIDAEGRRGAWGKWGGPLQRTPTSSSHAAVRLFPCERPGPLLAFVTFGPNPGPAHWGVNDYLNKASSHGELVRAQVKCLGQLN